MQIGSTWQTNTQLLHGIGYSDEEIFVQRIRTEETRETKRKESQEDPS